MRRVRITRSIEITSALRHSSNLVVLTVTVRVCHFTTNSTSDDINKINPSAPQLAKTGSDSTVCLIALDRVSRTVRRPDSDRRPMGVGLWIL
jgi:hypothetical protein